MTAPEKTTAPLEIFAVLVAILVASVWLMQSPINNYYQQKYHAPSPLTGLSQYPAWIAGDTLWNRLSPAREDPEIALDESDDEEEIPTQTVSTPMPQPDPVAAPVPNAVRVDAVLPELAANTPVATAPSAPAAPSAVQTAPEPAPAAHATTAMPVPAAAPPSLPAPPPAQPAGPYLQLNEKDRVLFAGDSLMQGIAPNMQRILKNTYNISSINLSKQSTGLAYPGFFDWPKTIAKTLADDNRIHLVIIMLGPNDPWDMPDPAAKRGSPYLKFESPAWETVYRERVSRIIQDARARNVKIFWVGAPNMKKSKLNDQVIWLMRVIQSEVNSAGVAWLDTRELLGSVNDKYSESVSIDGKQVKVRSADGIHYTIAGQKFLAGKVIENIQINADKIQ